MKAYFVTEDGKTFDTAENAEKYEAELKNKTLKNDAAKKELIAKIEKNKSKIAELKKQIGEILDENDSLLEQYRSLLDPEQQEFCGKLNDILNKIFGYDN